MRLFALYGTALPIRAETGKTHYIKVQEEEHMRRYETISILRPNLGEGEVTTIVENTSKIITDDQGSIIDLTKWGLKKLAYPIKKETQGLYFFCEYAATPAAVAEIERKFRIDDAVLKYLTIKIADSISADQIEQAISESKARNAAILKASEHDDTEDTKVDADDSDDFVEDED
jgi:small subunit ribosomal protein S6